MKDNPSGGGSGTAPKGASAELGIIAAAALVGFFAIPTIARLAPVWVNGFLLLVLFGSLLYNQERWVPYMQKLGK